MVLLEPTESEYGIVQLSLVKTLCPPPCLTIICPLAGLNSKTILPPAN